MTTTLTNGITFSRHREGWRVAYWGTHCGRVMRTRVAHRGRLVWRWEAYTSDGIVRTNAAGHYGTRTEAANALTLRWMRQAEAGTLPSQSAP